MTLPNFFLLGAAKSGTTSLYQYLRQHPDVYFPVNKEPQFFCNDQLYEKGLEFYCDRFFRNASSFDARGDATPHYLFYPKAGDRIRQSLPSSSHRFIVILRDPVERAYSHYKNMILEGMENLTFRDALEAEAARTANPEWERRGTMPYAYFSAGLYASQLRQYFEIFGQDRFLILFSKELAEDPSAVVNRVFDFLSLRSFRVEIDTRHNVSSRPRSARFQAWIRRPGPIGRAIGKRLPYEFGARVVQSLLAFNRVPGGFSILDAHIAAELRCRFKSDVEELEKITGQDLSGWKQ